MSRVVIYEKFGGPEVLDVREVPEPHAGPGEVRVRVSTIGLNPMDWIFSSMPEMAAQFASPCRPASDRTSPAPSTRSTAAPQGLPWATACTAARWEERPPTSWS